MGETWFDERGSKVCRLKALEALRDPFLSSSAAEESGTASSSDGPRVQSHPEARPSVQACLHERRIAAFVRNGTSCTSFSCSSPSVTWTRPQLSFTVRLCASLALGWRRRRCPFKKRIARRRLPPKRGCLSRTDCTLRVAVPA